MSIFLKEILKEIKLYYKKIKTYDTSNKSEIGRFLVYWLNLVFEH